jgi:hypothetical protein
VTLSSVVVGYQHFRGPCNRCSDCRKLLIEQSDLVAARAVFLKAMNEIKQSISDFHFENYNQFNFTV